MVTESPRFGLPDLGFQYCQLAYGVAGDSGAQVVEAEVNSIRRPNGVIANADLGNRYRKIKDGPLYLFGALLGLRMRTVGNWAENGFGMFQKGKARSEVESRMATEGLDAAVAWALENQTKGLDLNVLGRLLEDPYAGDLDADFFGSELARTFRKWRR